MVSPESCRAEFPALATHPDIAYLDSACMSLTPGSVLAAMESYYRDFPGCAGRSLHRFATEVSRRFEEARETFASYLGAANPAGVVFLRNATEAINLVGSGLNWKAGDRVVISDQEHNSNLVPWQRLRRERGIEIDIFHLSDDGTFDGDAFDQLLQKGARLVSLFHTSNLDGRTLPAREIVERAHDRHALVMLDGCQAAPHERPDLQRTGIDFYAVSAHKMLGPTGTGLLAARPEALEEIRPLCVGGETVEWSTLEDHELRAAPHRFEAGLQNYAGILGAKAGVEFLLQFDPSELRSREIVLNRTVSEAFEDEPRFRILGPQRPEDRPSIVAFSLDGVDPHDAALFLDEGHQVMVRSGRHCVHSWYERRGLSGNVRASFYLYNNHTDAKKLVAGITELLGSVGGKSPTTGTSEPKSERRAPLAPSPGRSAGSRGAAARSARPRGTTARGRGES
jgi:cysteine desulfurase / selenocysteine lyase